MVAEFACTERSRSVEAKTLLSLYNTKKANSFGFAFFYTLEIEKI